MMPDLSDLDRRLAVARLVDEIERDTRAGVAAERKWELLRTLGLLLVAALAAVLTWAARRASR